MDGGFPFRLLGKTLLAVAAVLAVIGAALTFAGRVPGLGRLPGDLVFRRGQTTVYLPIATCVVLSILLSLVLWWIGRR